MVWKFGRGTENLGQGLEIRDNELKFGTGSENSGYGLKIRDKDGKFGPMTLINL